MEQYIYTENRSVVTISFTNGQYILFDIWMQKFTLMLQIN